jgi:hypothetical protein
MRLSRVVILLLLAVVIFINSAFVFPFVIRQLALPVLEYVLPRVIWVVPINLIFQKYYKSANVVENVEIKAYKGIEIGNVVLFTVAVPKLTLEKTELKAFSTFNDPFFDFGLSNRNNERSSFAFRMNEQGLVLQVYEILPGDVFDIFDIDANFDYDWILQYIKYYEYDSNFIDVSGVFLIKDQFYETTVEYNYYRWTIVQYYDEYFDNNFFETFADCKRSLENFLIQNNINEGLFVIKQYKETIYYKDDDIVGIKSIVVGIDVFGRKEGINTDTKDLINLNDEDVVVKVKEISGYDVITVGVFKDSLRLLTKEELLSLDKIHNGAVIESFNNADVINVGGVEQSVLDGIELASWEYSEDQATEQEIQESQNYLNNLKDEIINSWDSWVEDFSQKISQKFPFSIFSDIIYIWDILVQYGSYDYNDIKWKIKGETFIIPYLNYEVNFVAFVEYLDIYKPLIEIVKFINTFVFVIILLKLYRRFLPV